MTEHHFMSNTFFDALGINNPQNDLVDAKDLIETVQSVDNQTQKFHKKNFNFLIIAGVFMFIIGILALISKDLGITLLMFAIAVSLPLLLQILNHQPDKLIKRKLQKFQKGLSKGLKKRFIKTLTRSKNDKMIFGVLGGIGQYFNIPPWLLRVIALSLLFISGGIILIFYFALTISLPEEETLHELED